MSNVKLSSACTTLTTGAVILSNGGQAINIGKVIESLQNEVTSLSTALDRLTKALDRDPAHTTLEQRLTYIEDTFEFAYASNHYEEIKPKQ